MRPVAVLLAVLATLVPWATDGRAAEADAGAGRLGAGIIDEELECLEPVPRQVAPGPTPLDGRRARLHVLMLLDGVIDFAGVKAARDAVVAYRPAGIDLRVRYARVRVPADGRNRGFDGLPYFTASTDRAMAVAKAAVGGQRPPDVDLVYLLTNKDLYLGADQPDASRRQYAVAGMADCIGGIRYPHRAFAIGERLSFGDTGSTVRMGRRLPGKIFGHEIGHLLGAHHHAANCAEPVAAAALERSTDVCTLMFNDVSLIALRFSVVNRPVVRGHALVYG